jgi:hypothetical protein
MDSQNENHVIQFYIRQVVGGEFYLELGDETLLETDLMSKVELLKWAEDNELHELSIEEIVEIKNRQDTENGNIISSPSSRAFEFFGNEINSALPPELGIEFIEGFIPGNDTQVVIIRDLLKVEQIKHFLRCQNLLINFTLIENDV